MKPRLLLIFLVTLIIITNSPVSARADGVCDRLEVCAPDVEGLLTGHRFEDVANLPEAPNAQADGSSQPATGAPRYEYASTSACTMSPPGSAEGDTMCTMALTTCSDPSRGSGPLTRIWRRTVQDGQPPSAWVPVGVTCYPDVVSVARPIVTLAMIRDAFNRTPWAKPTISTQPAGNVTLVGLDTFYKVNWSAEGFQPGEVDAIDPSRMNGYRVDVRVKLVNFMWQFGDGQTFGPTTSEGGVYPSGNITHQYLKAGAYPANVTTTFGGEFRIDGGEWAPIPDTVSVPGPTTTVTVRTAQAELVNR